MKYEKSQGVVLSYLDPSARIDPTAQIGADCKVWINAQIRENAVVGERTVISKDVYIDTNVAIGKRCKIQNGVSIYQGVIVGDDVFIGPMVAFTNDKVPRAFNQNWQVVQTNIHTGVSIGANATILCGITIGEYAMVGAGSVVTKDVEPYTLVIGAPAKPYAKIDKLGNKIKNDEI